MMTRSTSMINSTFNIIVFHVPPKYKIMLLLRLAFIVALFVVKSKKAFCLLCPSEVVPFIFRGFVLL